MTSSALAPCSLSAILGDGDDRHVDLGPASESDHTCIDLRPTLFPSPQPGKTPALGGRESDFFFLLLFFLLVGIKSKISLFY